MRKLIASVLLAGALATGGCSWISKHVTEPSPSADGGIVNCLAADVHSTVVSILPDVAAAIATSDYVAELGTLAGHFGIDAVNCAVQALETYLETAHFQGASADETVETMLAHARAYLDMPPLPDASAPQIGPAGVQRI